MNTRRTFYLIGLAFGFNALLALWLLVRPAPAPVVDAVDNVAQFLGILLILPACFTGVRERFARRPMADGAEGSSRLQVWVPALLGLGALSMAAGQMIYTFYEQILHQTAPFPSWADGGYLGVYPFLLAGIILLSSQRLTTVSRTRIILDGLMVMAVVITFSWYFILGPTLLQATDSLFGKIVGAAYPTGDLVLMVCLLLLTTHRNDPFLRRAGAILTLALTIIVITDSVYDYETLHNGYATGSILDIGWPLGYMLVVAGADAVRQRARLGGSVPINSANQPAETHDRILWRTLLPYPLVPLVAGLTLYVFAIGERNELRFGVLFGAALLIVLILIRQILAILENAQLYRDVQRKSEQLEALATTDPLTNLPNHRALMTMLDHELERASRYRRPCSIVVLDLDHFKALNDGLGHGAGDAALRQFAQVVRQNLRSIDMVGRWGGEEFVVILPETDRDGALPAAEHVRAAIAGHTFVVGGGIHLTCSLGVATYPDAGGTRDQLLDAADRAMYAAKRLGRNQVRAVDEPAVVALGDAAERLSSRDDTALLGTVEALAALVDARDAYTGQHASEVATLGMRLALALGLDATETHLVGLAGRLHDVGKVVVPDAVLQKPGRLSDDDWSLIRKHPVVGADVVSRVPALRVLAPAIRAHHERWDGTGYPDGLAGSGIPLIARIISVADAYGAMTSDRPYRQRCAPVEAIAEIRRCAAAQFDSTVVEALERLVAIDRALGEERRAG